MLSSEYDPERVILQMACTDYAVGSNLVVDMLKNMVKITGTEPNLVLGEAEPAFGWAFYRLSVDKTLVRRLAGTPETDIVKMKGATLDQKFSVWLNRQLHARTEGVRVQLMSNLKSSKFGLF